MFMTSVGGKYILQLTESDSEKERICFFPTYDYENAAVLLMRYSSVWLRVRP